jgi:hypothetical protein
MRAVLVGLFVARGRGRLPTRTPTEVLMQARIVSVVSHVAELCLFFAAAAVLAAGLMSMR